MYRKWLLVCIKLILFLFEHLPPKPLFTKLNQILNPHYQNPHTNNTMNHQRTQRQILQYMVTVTQKLSRTCRELSQMGRQLLKSFNHNDRSERYKNRHRQKDYEKQKDDLNSNLIDEEEEEELAQMGVNVNGRKKLKIKNRIEEAEEEEEEVIKEPEVKFSVQQQQNIPLNPKKAQEKPQKQKQPSQPQANAQDINKKKPKSISHKPKAPTSSFLLFFKQQQQSIAKSYPNYGVVELTKVAAKCWNQLSVQQKDPYQKLFEIQRKKYQQEMEKYKKMFPEQVRRKEMEKKEKKKKRAKQRRQKQGKQVKQVKQVKQPKQKPIPIVANSDINPYNNITPGGVKLQDLPQGQNQKEPDYQDQNDQYIKNEEEMASQELGSLDGESEENSLGEDI